MSYSAADYRAQLQALLPSGPAWPREDDAALSMLLQAWADEFARLDARVEQLLGEYDPRRAYELLGEWETALGLPDACTAAATSIAARQALCWRKLAYGAGQTPAFFIALAASLGFEIEIHEFDPNVDDYDAALTPLITEGRWRYVWRVHVLNAGNFSYFRAGDPVGNRLVEGEAAIDLECIFASAQPAHTHVVFSYPEDEDGNPAVPPEASYVTGVLVGFETPTAIDLSGAISGSYTSIYAADGVAGTTSVSGSIVTYTPAAGYYGTDGFAFTASGAGGTSGIAVVSLTVASVAAPEASDLSGVNVAYQTPTAIDLSGSITGVHSSIAVRPGDHGTITVAGDIVTYTPVDGYSGGDTFTFRATGAGGTSPIATVSLTVAAVTPATVAPVAVTATGRRPTPIDLASYIGGIHSAVEIDAPLHGTASVTGDVVTYVPDVALSGDIFAYRAIGPGGISADATITVTFL